MPQLLKGGFSEGVSTRVDVYSIRQPLGVVAIISPFNFPAMVPCWFFPIAIAAGNTVVAEAEREGSVGRQLARRAVGRGRAARRACSTSCTATRSRSTALLEHPDVQGGVVRRLDADRALRVRDRDARRASACRRSAARRTTWSCCPTPTSTSRPTPRSTRASARPASGAWRSRRRRGRRRSPTSSSPKIAERIGGLHGRRRPRPAPTWARSSPRAHLDKVASYLDAGVQRGRRRSSSTAASASFDGDAAGFWLGPDALRPRHARHGRSTPTRSSARCSRSCASTPTTTRSRS